MDTITIASPEEIAKEAHLHYISPERPGYTRTMQKDGCIYLNEQGKKITDQQILKRIESLRIPPAWQYVWISPSPLGHIQAVGIDEKHRKQYVYHQQWIVHSQENKFNKLIFFSNVLPTLREKMYADLKLPGLPQEKVLATVIWLLEHTYIRVGNQEYAKENKHFGLTTFRNRHVEITGQEVTFHFVGKSGKEHEVSIEHPRVAKTIKQLEDLPGYDLFQYITSEGKRHLITSEDVNEYLHVLTGDTVSAKDFRTWGATVLAAETLHTSGPAKTKKEIKKHITYAVKTVSKHLRNTPTVARTYYIHPAIPKSYEAHMLIPYFEEAYRNTSEKKYFSKEEEAVQRLLKESA